MKGLINNQGEILEIWNCPSLKNGEQKSILDYVIHKDEQAYLDSYDEFGNRKDLVVRDAYYIQVDLLVNECGGTKNCLNCATKLFYEQIKTKLQGWRDYI